MSYELLENNPGIAGVVQTPGGLSNVYHGDGGMYSTKTMSSNMFGNSLPPSWGQPRGNLYGPGESYTESGRVRREYFSVEGKDYDMITDISSLDTPQSSASKSSSSSSNSNQISTSTIIIQGFVLLVVLVVLFFAIDLWGKFALNLIREYVFNGRPLRTWNLGSIALASTVVLIVMVSITGIPFVSQGSQPSPTPSPFR